MLNNGDKTYTDKDLSKGTIPVWVKDLTTDTKLSDSGITAETYRETWNAYNNALAISTLTTVRRRQ